MIAWNIGLSINDRLIYGLESVPDGNPVNPVTKRFVSWDIDEKYWPRQHKILISPLPDHWEEYYPIMNDNVRQLLYDDRG